MSTDETILAEIEDVIRCMPDWNDDWHSEAAFDWVGRAVAILKVLGHGAQAVSAGDDATSEFLNKSWNAKRKLKTMLAEGRHLVRFRTTGPLSVAVSQGMVFDYYNGLSKILKEATEDVLVVDPYLDQEFLSRYVPSIATSAKVRLLASKYVSQLEPAAELFSKQYNRPIEVRNARASIHDRFVFIDKARGFQSGASFSQGGAKHPSLITEVTDTLDAIVQIYEDKWVASGPADERKSEG